MVAGLNLDQLLWFEMKLDRIKQLELANDVPEVDDDILNQDDLAREPVSLSSLSSGSDLLCTFCLEAVHLLAQVTGEGFPY